MLSGKMALKNNHYYYAQILHRLFESNLGITSVDLSQKVMGIIISS